MVQQRGKDFFISDSTKEKEEITLLKEECLITCVS